jgi:hypothetical protein
MTCGIITVIKSRVRRNVCKDTAEEKAPRKRILRGLLLSSSERREVTQNLFRLSIKFNGSV